MIDFGFDKLALIGAVALIVIGPERLPRVARTVGHLLGKAQRYVSDVKAEVSRSIELEELKKMKGQFEDAAESAKQSVEQEVSSANQAFEQTWADASSGLNSDSQTSYDGGALGHSSYKPPKPPKLPKKNWRLKRGSTPQWYKQNVGVRRHIQSGAARVARFRPVGRPF